MGVGGEHTLYSAMRITRVAVCQFQLLCLLLKVMLACRHLLILQSLLLLLLLLQQVQLVLLLLLVLSIQLRVLLILAILLL